MGNKLKWDRGYKKEDTYIYYSDIVAQAETLRIFEEDNINIHIQ